MMSLDELRVPTRRLAERWPEANEVAPPLAGFRDGDDFFKWCTFHLAEEGQLTPTEEAVCELLLLGRYYSEIAEVREVSLETVKWHVKRILRKLDVCSTREFLQVLYRRLNELSTLDR